MKVIAVDPGLTTGVAVYNHGEFNSFEVPGGLLPAATRVRDLLTPGSVLIYEKFVISSSTVKKDLTAAYLALYINGAIQLAASDKECARIVAQTPNQKEWGAQFLRAIDWHVTSPGNHANDAASHLLKFLADNHQLSGELLSRIIDSEFT